jgi:hypothetical protein
VQLADACQSTSYKACLICEVGLYSVFKDLFKDLTMAVIGSCYVIHLKALNSDSLAVKLADPSQSTSF